MEYNQYNNEQQDQGVVLKEKKSSSGGFLWWIVALLALLILLGYGYTAGWFGSRTSTDVVDQTPVGQVQTETPDKEQVLANFFSGDLAPINAVTIQTAESFPVQQNVFVKGELPNGCTYLNDPQQFREGNVFYVALSTRTEGEVCTEALVPYERTIPLETIGLPGGVYIVNVNGQEISFELEMDNVLDFNSGEGK